MKIESMIVEIDILSDEKNYSLSIDILQFYNTNSRLNLHITVLCKSNTLGLAQF